jgi:hypothetical protein
MRRRRIGTRTPRRAPLRPTCPSPACRERSMPVGPGRSRAARQTRYVRLRFRRTRASVRSMTRRLGKRAGHPARARAERRPPLAVLGSPPELVSEGRLHGVFSNCPASGAWDGSGRFGGAFGELGDGGERHVPVVRASSVSLAAALATHRSLCTTSPPCSRRLRAELPSVRPESVRRERRKLDPSMKLIAERVHESRRRSGVRSIL